MNTLETMPDAPLAAIFSNFSVKDMVRLSRTCKRWHTISQSPLIWKELVKNHDRSFYNNINKEEGEKDWLLVKRILILEEKAKKIKRDQTKVSNMFFFSSLALAVSCAPAVWNSASKVVIAVVGYIQSTNAAWKEESLVLCEKRAEKMIAEYPTLTLKIARVLAKHAVSSLDIDFAIQLILKYPGKELEIAEYLDRRSYVDSSDYS